MHHHHRLQHRQARERSLRLDVDGQRDLQFTSQHVGKGTFDNAATTKRGRQTFSAQLEELVAGLEREWTLQRGRTLASKATSLDERMRAAVLLSGFAG